MFKADVELYLRKQKLVVPEAVGLPPEICQGKIMPPVSKNATGGFFAVMFPDARYRQRGE